MSTYEARVKTVDGGHYYWEAPTEEMIRAQVEARIDELTARGGPLKPIGFNIWERSANGSVTEISLRPLMLGDATTVRTLPTGGAK